MIRLHAEREAQPDIPLGEFATQDIASDWLEAKSEDWLEGYNIVSRILGTGLTSLYLGDYRWEKMED